SFSLGNQIIKSSTSYSFNYREASLKNVLDQTAAKAHLDYKVRNQIVLVRPLASTTQSSVRGVVVDDTGMPLPGASVVEKGSSNGVTTDFNGAFELELQSQSPVLIVSYLGFQTQEIAVAGEINFNITLIANSEALDEVVVIGYGQQSRAKIIGS